MFANPAQNLKSFGLKEDNIVADLGAGTGYYSIAAGAMVPRGKVYAVELDKDFLMTVKKKVAEAHLDNVECLWGDVEKLGGTKLGDGVIDAVIASNVLFQVEDRDSFAEEVKRILKPKGRVLLVDWTESSIVRANLVISKEKARLLFEKRGFILEREINAGDFHYGMILIKS
ncbi:MAG: class I SAM-dependent methyltransferase [Minisyncoccia bacterium]